jgi:hypothetical protein
MPRHRKGGGRTHGTLRREDGSRRSVLPRILAAGRGARRAPRRHPRPGHGLAAARSMCRRRLRLARALMVTPWFAASAGIVIAAALAVESPAALTYVPSPGVPCPASGCGGSATSQPNVTAASPGVKLKAGPAPKAAATASPGRRHAAGAVYQLRYRVVRHWRGGFVAVITLPDDMNPGPWSLQLAFPSARVDRVWGARWQPWGDGDAGTATGSWTPPRGHGRDSPGQDGRELVILAAGAPAPPSSCSLEGAGCGFGR